MLKYTLKKILMLILTMLLVSFVVFALFNVIPGDPALNKLGTNATPEKLEAMRESMGLNGNFFLRYFKWIGGYFVGNFGTSYSYSCSVGSLIFGKIPINATYSIMAVLFVCLISFPVGIYTAKHTGGRLEKVISVVNQVAMAVPPFLMGIILTFIFGLGLHFFVPGQFVSYTDNFFGFLGYMICPALALAIPKSAMCIKLLRTNILEEAGKDYAKCAYSKGNDTTNLLYRYVLKNAAMPTITFIGMVFADMIASGIIVEQTFGIPGLSLNLLNAVSTRDYPVVEAIVMFIAAGIVTTSTLTDIIQALMDKRIRLE